MSAPLTVVLPDAKAVKDMLSGLVGKPVGVLPGAPVTPTPKSPVSVAVYVDPSMNVNALCVMDLGASAYTGAALALLPAGGAQDAVEEDGELTTMLTEALHEVVNVLSALFNVPVRRTRSCTSSTPPATTCPATSPARWPTSTGSTSPSTSPATARAGSPWSSPRGPDPADAPGRRRRPPSRRPGRSTTTAPRHSASGPSWRVARGTSAGSRRPRPEAHPELARG